MRAFVLICCLAFAAARPEAPGGYAYNRPQSGGSSGGYSGSSSGGYSGGSSGGYSGGSSGGFSGGSNSFGSSGGSSFGNAGGSSFGNSGGSSFGNSGFGNSGFGGSSAGSFGGSGAGGYSSGGSFGGQQSAIVQKHIYVHVPPPEPEEQFVQRPLQIAPAQKHYKIIFIKAPSPPQYQAPIIPIQPQNEEKTLVYVLVKKPEAPQDIVIPTSAPTQPSKPEVYFIKYKTQKEAGGAVGGDYAGDSGIIGSDIQGGSNLGVSAGGIPSSQYGPPGK